MSWRCAASSKTRGGRIVRCTSTHKPHPGFCGRHQPAEPANGVCMQPSAKLALVALRERLKSRRTTLGISRKALADLIGVSSQSVANWERGGATPPAPILAPMSHALGVDPNWLLGVEDSPKAGEAK